MKKRGFGAGRWNGFGGKVLSGETIEAAARRELTEEAGIAAEDLRKTGVLTFRFVQEPELLDVHVFRVTAFSGTPSETDEMRPKWFTLVHIPYRKMWPDDSLWLPLLLTGKCFRGFFHFADQDTLLRQEVAEIAVNHPLLT